MLKSNIKPIAVSRGIKSSKDFSIKLQSVGILMSSQNAARYLRENPPSMKVEFIDALCKLFACSVADLFVESIASQKTICTPTICDGKFESNNEIDLKKIGPRSKMF